MQYFALILFALTLDKATPCSAQSHHNDTVLPEAFSKVINLPQNDGLILFFVNPGNCQTCTEEDCQAGEKRFAHLFKSESHLELVAAVHGSRPVAVAFFKKEYFWPGHAILDSNSSLRQLLSLPPDTRVAVYDHRHRYVGAIRAALGQPVDWSGVATLVKRVKAP